MADPFAHDEFLGEPNLPHYGMIAQYIQIPETTRPDQYEAEITLRIPIDGPERLVAAVALKKEEVDALCAELQRVLREAERLWEGDLG